MLTYAAEAAAAEASEREAAGFVEVWEYQESTANWALVRIRTHTYAYVRIRIHARCGSIRNYCMRGHSLRKLHATGR